MVKYNRSVKEVGRVPRGRMKFGEIVVEMWLEPEGRARSVKGLIGMGKQIDWLALGDKKCNTIIEMPLYTGARL